MKWCGGKRGMNGTIMLDRAENDVGHQASLPGS